MLKYRCAFSPLFNLLTHKPGSNNDRRGGIASERLQSFVERLERLEEEKAALSEDIKEVYSEAKSGGFDIKIMRQIVRLRKMNTADRREQGRTVRPL